MWREPYKKLIFEYIIFHNLKFNLTDIKLSSDATKFLEECKIEHSVAKNMLEEDKKYASYLKLEGKFKQKTAELSPESYFYLEHIDELLLKIQKFSDAKIFDKSQSKYIQLEEGKPQFPGFKKRININKVKNKNGYELHTHGLNKYGVPDIQVFELPNFDIKNAEKIIHESAHNMLLSDDLEFVAIGNDIKLEFMNNSKRHFDKDQVILTYAKRL